MVLKTHAERLAGALRSPERDRDIDSARSDARALRIQAENFLEAIKVHPKGLDKHRIKIAGDAAQLLEENAATILAAQAAWNTQHPESDTQLQLALVASKNLVTQLNEAIR
jgi:hypothetical protein